MTTLPLSPAYRNAVWAGLLFQIPIVVILCLILDLGEMAMIGACALAGFWLGAAAVMLRRPRKPTRLDLLYIRWGYLPMLVAGYFIVTAFKALRIHGGMW